MFRKRRFSPEDFSVAIVNEPNPNLQPRVTGEGRNWSILYDCGNKRNIEISVNTNDIRVVYIIDKNNGENDLEIIATKPHVFSKDIYPLVAFDLPNISQYVSQFGSERYMPVTERRIRRYAKKRIRQCAPLDGGFYN